MTAPELSLVLVGFGHVGRRFVRLLEEVAERLDFEWRVVGIGTTRSSIPMALTCTARSRSSNRRSRSACSTRSGASGADWM